jgi:hypothetical protein
MALLNNTLFSQIITISRLQTFDDFVLTQENFEIMKLAKILEIMQLIPENEYSPEIAWCIVGSFPLNVQVSAFEYLKEIGASIKRSDNHKSTGRGFRTSETFIQTLSGFLDPKIFFQAKRFLKLNEGSFDGLSLDIYKDVGTMSVLIDFFYFDEYEYEIIDRLDQDPFLIIRKSSDSHNLSNLKKRAPEEEPHIASFRKIQKHDVESESVMDFEDDLITEISQKIGLQGALLESVFVYIDSKKCLGVSIHELKVFLFLTQVNFGQIDFKSILQHFTDRKLVYLVGFNSYRYVSHYHYKDWLVIVEPKKYGTEVVNFYPWIWSSLSGNCSDQILRKCTEAILSLVVKRPGITEVKLY